MAASIGMQWRHGATILTKCKLLNVISDQLMDCNVIKDDYTHIAVHKLDQNNVEKLQFDRNCPHNWQFWPKISQMLAQ